MGLPMSALTCVLLISIPTFSLGEVSEKMSAYDLPKLVALQNRTYFVNKALTLHLGYLPADAFNKGLLLGGSYSYYFTEFAAWEIVNGNYSFNIPTDVKKDLEALNIGVTGQTSPFLDYVNWYVTTGAIYTPLYNKSLLFNRSVVYGETSFYLGGGMAKYEYAGMRPMVGGGLIFQYFLSPTSSLKFDFRNYVVFAKTSGVSSVIHLSAGYTLQLGEPPKNMNSEPLEE